MGRRGTSCTSAGGGLRDGSGRRLPPGSCPSFPHRSRGANSGGGGRERRRPPAPGFQSLARSPGLGGSRRQASCWERRPLPLQRHRDGGFLGRARASRWVSPTSRSAHLPRPGSSLRQVPRTKASQPLGGESRRKQLDAHLTKTKGERTGQGARSGTRGDSGTRPRLPPGPKALRSSTLGILPRKPRARPPDAPSPRVPPAGERDSGAKSVALLVTERWGTLKIHAMSPVHYI